MAKTRKAMVKREDSCTITVTTRLGIQTLTVTDTIDRTEAIRRLRAMIVLCSDYGQRKAAKAKKAPKR